jgi:hypothetical protein
MIKKSYSKNGDSCRVTFLLPADAYLPNPFGSEDSVVRV